MSIGLELLGIAPVEPSATATPEGDGHEIGDADQAIPVPPRLAALQAQRHSIRAALEASGGNWAQAARSRGIDASNLHKLAHRLGLK